MKKILIIIFTQLFIMMVFYLATTVGYGSFDITTWEEAGLVSFLYAVSAFSTMAYFFNLWVK